MTNSLYATLIIINILKEYKDLTDLISSDSIYPVCATLGAKFPFIIITRESILPDYNKGPYTRDDIILNATIVTTTYIEGIKIAQLVRKALENTSISNDTVDFPAIRIDNIQEGMEYNLFILLISFKIVSI